MISHIGSTVADAVIAGRGPAALAAALALREKGIDVVVLGPAAGDNLAHRGETVPAASVAALSRLFPQDPFKGAAHLPCYGHFSVWGSDTVQERSSILNANGPAVILDHRSFMEALEAQFKSAGGRLVTTTNLCVSHEDDAFRVTIGDSGGEGNLSCRAVVDATGVRASAARSLGATRHVWARQIAFGASYGSPTLTSDSAATVIEALDNGWLYGAPTGSGVAVVWWVTDHDLAKFSGMDIQDRVQHNVNRSVYVAQWIRDQNLRPDGRAVARNASVGGLDRVAGDGWVAVGDAALALDPLSSSGISAALLSGYHGGRALSAWIKGHDAGLVSYAEMVTQVRVRHLEQRRRLYRLERRWASTPFWHRRSGPSSLRDDWVPTVQSHSKSVGAAAPETWTTSTRRAHGINR